MANKSSKVAIIGAGYTGLSAALKLLESGYQVTIYERERLPGGLVSTLDVGGTKLERFYHHFFVSDTHLTELAQELNLEEKIIWIEPKTAIYVVSDRTRAKSSNSDYYQGDFFQLKTPLDLLTFTPLPIWQRLNFGTLMLKSSRLKDWQKLDEISAKDWIKWSAGEDVYNVLWEPLLVSKFGRHADSISAAWLWNKFKLRGASRNKKGNEVLGYFKDGGFAQLTEALSKKVVKLGGDFRFNSQIDEVKEKDGQWLVFTQGKGEMFDSVVSTIAPSIFSQLVPSLNRNFIHRLEEINYQANICLVAEMKHSLSDIYWLSVEDVNCPFVAVIEHTNFVPKEWYGDKHIVYLSRYLDPEEPLFKASDAQVAEKFFKYLQKIYPDFSLDWVEKITVSRAKFTQPITEVGHLKRLLPIETSHPGLFLASMSQIYPEDRGTNYAIKLGYQVAELVKEKVASGSVVNT